RHTHALEDAGRESRGTDGPRDLEHGTVRFWATAEMVTTDNARETASLAGSDYVDETLSFKDIDEHAVTNLHGAVGLGLLFDLNRNLPEELHGRQIVLGKMSSHRLREAGIFHKLHKSKLRRLVSVARARFALSHYARTCLQHSCRTYFALRIEQLRHADFLSQNSSYLCHLLIPSQRGRGPLAGS